MLYLPIQNTAETWVKARFSFYSNDYTHYAQDDKTNIRFHCNSFQEAHDLAKQLNKTVKAISWPYSYEI